MLFKYYTSALLSNKNLWLWGVAFMFFWLFIGAYSFSNGLPSNLHAVLVYTSIWYGIIAQYSLSSISIIIAVSIYYASSSLAFAFRYTKLKPVTYVVSLIGSSSVLGVMLSIVMLVSTFGLFSEKFGFTVIPYNPLESIAISALGGIFMMAFSMLLVLILVNYVGLRSTAFISFLPLILSYGFGFTQLNVSLPPAMVYLSPYTEIQSLLFETYSGQAAAIKLISSDAGNTLQWPFLLAALIIWMVVLIAIDSYLLRSLRGRHIEEARQF